MTKSAERRMNLHKEFRDKVIRCQPFCVREDYEGVCGQRNFTYSFYPTPRKAMQACRSANNGRTYKNGKRYRPFYKVASCIRRDYKTNDVALFQKTGAIHGFRQKRVQIKCQRQIAPAQIARTERRKFDTMWAKLERAYSERGRQ